uniref:Uncharacterized protein n=2 Tax=Babesia bovis TaxID=5865 RepID=A7ASK8_BABBO|eukprot:XP_001611095.1 hypothetical protein [Babesia bovis T2Bo]
MTKNAVGPNPLELSEQEHMTIASSLDSLFDRCVQSCDHSDFQTAVGNIREFMSAYKGFYSHFFEEPVEVAPPLTEVPNAAIHRGDQLLGDSCRSAQDVPRTDSSGSMSSSKPLGRYKASRKALSYEYTDDIDSRRWRVEARSRIPRDVCGMILYQRSRCVGIMGRIMHKVSSLEDLRTVISLSKDACLLGMDVLKSMYEAMCIMNARMGRTTKALEYIERMWSHGERRRYRTYETLLNHFEGNLDSEGILQVLRHMVDTAGLTVNGLLLTRVLVAICLSARQELMKHCNGAGSNITSDTMGNLSDQSSDGRSQKHLSSMLGLDCDRESVPVLDAESGNHTLKHPTSTDVDNKARKVKDTLKRQLEEVFQIFSNHACNRVALSARLGYVIYSVFSRAFPDLVRFTHVSPNKLSGNLPINTEHLGGRSAFKNPSGITKDLDQSNFNNGHSKLLQGDGVLPDNSATYGNCVSCNFAVPLVDLGIAERLSVLRRWLQHIYDYNYPEILRLANFYAWLYAPLTAGKGYTCVLDGQNIGYHKRESMSPMDFEKVDIVLQSMISLGERPFIVLPYYCRTRKTVSSSVLTNEAMELLFPGCTLPSALLNQVPVGKHARLKYSDRHKAALIDKWYSQRQVYFCASDSYDDNYFFLANVMSGCAEELHTIATFVKSALALLLQQQGDASMLPEPEIGDYAAAACPSRRPLMMTVTNDTLSNMEIPGVDEGAMRALRDIPLTPYFFTDGWSRRRHSDDRKVVVGQRLRYSLGNVGPINGKFHIPLGYERKVLDYKARHTVLISEHEEGCIEPPISGAYLDTQSDESHNSDQELKQINQWLERHGYNELFNALCDKHGRSYPQTEPRRFPISTKSPEIIKQKFNPTQETRWLCIDLNVLGNTNV